MCVNEDINCDRMIDRPGYGDRMRVIKCQSGLWFQGFFMTLSQNLLTSVTLKGLYFLFTQRVHGFRAHYKWVNEGLDTHGIVKPERSMTLTLLCD